LQNVSNALKEEFKPIRSEEMSASAETGVPRTIKAEQPPVSAGGSGFVVFHVNDSTDDQVLFQAACKSAGVPLVWHVADSAEKGISYLETLVRLSKKHDVRWPDLILLDIVMPGDNGFRVLEYIRHTSELSRLPVVIFTGHGNPSLISEANELGANSFLPKPADFHEAVQIAGSLYKAWGFTRPEA
jgi:CheY-like chemotaxis protein